MVMDVFKTEPSKYGGLNGLITLVVNYGNSHFVSFFFLKSLISFLENEIYCLFSQMCAYSNSMCFLLQYMPTSVYII